MKRILASLAAISAVIVLSGCSYLYPHWGETTPPPSTPTPTSSNSASATPTATPPKPKQPVGVEIMQSNVDPTSSQLQVVAQATGISEDNGICTLTVKQGSTVKSVSAKAESNVSDTQCFPLNLSIIGLSPGDATFTVSYNSDSYTGTTSANTVTIP